MGQCCQKQDLKYKPKKDDEEYDDDDYSLVSSNKYHEYSIVCSNEVHVQACILIDSDMDSPELLPIESSPAHPGYDELSSQTLPKQYQYQNQDSPPPLALITPSNISTVYTSPHDEILTIPKELVTENIGRIDITYIEDVTGAPVTNTEETYPKTLDNEPINATSDEPMTLNATSTHQADGNNATSMSPSCGETEVSVELDIKQVSMDVKGN